MCHVDTFTVINVCHSDQVSQASSIAVVDFHGDYVSQYAGDTVMQPRSCMLWHAYDVVRLFLCYSSTFGVIDQCDVEFTLHTTSLEVSCSIYGDDLQTLPVSLEDIVNIDFLNEAYRLPCHLQQIRF